MFSSIGLTVAGLVFISLIAIFYFTKRKNHTLENDIFTVLLIFTICLLLLELICVYFISIRQLCPIITEILCRTYIFGVIVWNIIIFVYLYTLNRSFGYKNNKEILKEPFLIIISLIGTLAFVLSCFLPIKYTSGSGQFYVINGQAVFALYVCFLGLGLYICYFLLSNKNKISLFKRMPLILFLIFLVLISWYQLNNFDFNDLTFLFVFCIIGIYFTVENPDIQLIKELEIANEKAIQADKEKTEFLSRMSHEIRTPINSIMGFSESIMNDKNFTLEELKEDSKNINLAANNLLETIENILDISNIESGKEEIKNVDYSIKDIVYELNSYVLSRLNKDVEFVFDIDEDFPSVINGDKLKIYKILYGILSNSIKFTKTGQIKLEILSNIVEDNVNLKFVVSDTGVGIKEEYLNKIFEKFSRLNQESLSDNYNSTGLGLSIVKDLVTLLGGTIEVESTYGVGTIFTINMVNKIVDNKGIGVISLIQYDNTDYIDYSKYKVLLIDDNKLSLKATKDLLTNFKFNVSICKNSLEGINKIKSKEKFDMIMIDFNMEEMNGLEVLNVIKKLKSNNIPDVIVALSDGGTNEEKNECLKQGFTDYLIKPVEYKMLKKLIIKYFDNKKAGDK